MELAPLQQRRIAFTDMGTVRMERKEYSAGMVKHSFWFLEFRKMISLLLGGDTMEEIKQMNQDENIFSASTIERAKQIFNTVSTRVRSLDRSLYTFFIDGEIVTQKTIALIAVMNTDRLFFDFTYEVYREKLILGDKQLLDSDIRVFFRNKQIQSGRVAGWQDYTLKRLGICYKTMLAEAGVINRNSASAIITKPVLDISLINCLMENDMGQFINALTGDSDGKH